METGVARKGAPEGALVVMAKLHLEGDTELYFYAFLHGGKLESVCIISYKSMPTYIS